jgi:hypothetical protein
MVGKNKLECLFPPRYLPVWIAVGSLERVSLTFKNNLPRTNSLAYYDPSTVKKEKKYYNFDTRYKVIKLFIAVISEC